MTLPELEALTVTELRAHTSYALDHYFNMRGIDSHAHLIEAQFYMRELEQRDSEKIANRDYRMELGIMALILVEIIIAIFGIWLGFKEAKEQIAASQTETAAMQELQRSARVDSRHLNAPASHDFEYERGNADATAAHISRRP